MRVKCFGCDFKGDALHLLAAVYGLDLRRDFRRVLDEAAHMAGRPLEDLASLRVSIPPRPAVAAAERGYPPLHEVEALWNSCYAVSDSANASTWCVSRGLAPERLDGGGLARVIRANATLPRWARYRRVPWSETGHSLIVPMFDEVGRMRSVRACRIVDGETPKRLPPGGHRASGLIMACDLARAMLRGTWAPRRLIIVEGEPDFFTWAMRTGITAHARIGIVSGAWTDAIAARIPNGTRVIVRTDHDPHGDAYADQIIRSLVARCDVLRSKAEAA